MHVGQGQRVKSIAVGQSSRGLRQRILDSLTRVLTSRLSRFVLTNLRSLEAF